MGKEIPSWVQIPNTPEADCDNCVGICCISPYFSARDGFACDKEAFVPCPHMDRTEQRCNIHDTLEHASVECSKYDCGGAGQMVTQLAKHLDAELDTFLGVYASGVVHPYAHAAVPLQESDDTAQYNDLRSIQLQSLFAVLTYRTRVIRELHQLRITHHNGKNEQMYNLEQALRSEVEEALFLVQTAEGIGKAIDTLQDRNPEDLKNLFFQVVNSEGHAELFSAK